MPAAFELAVEYTSGWKGCPEILLFQACTGFSVSFSSEFEGPDRRDEECVNVALRISRQRVGNRRFPSLRFSLPSVMVRA